MWRKSSYSGSNQNCVEVANYGQVRDSKNRTGPVLLFSPDAWRRFTQDPDAALVR